MDAELAGLAAASVTWVASLDDSAWDAVRDRLARVLAADGREGEEAAAGDLDELRSELRTARREADAASVAEAEAVLRMRLLRAVVARPEAADELRALLEEPRPEGTVEPRNVIISGSSQGTVVHGGTVSGNIHFGGDQHQASTPPG
ncbi:hypothetical protein G5C51_24715, partial [Streptomyces sp. A7024]